MKNLLAFQHPTHKLFCRGKRDKFKLLLQFQSALRYSEIRYVLKLYTATACLQQKPQNLISQGMQNTG